jgi:chorismate--pyruvate lyase
MKISWKKKILKGNNQDLLNYKNSITNKVSKKANLKIQRIKDFPNLILNDELSFFKTSRSGKLYLREVLIFANNEPIIYARTVFKKNLRHLTYIIKKLNENPLANIVFKKKTSRSNFIFSHVSSNHKLLKRLFSSGIPMVKVSGARRSNFECEGEKILLTEVFFKNINYFK